MRESSEKTFIIELTWLSWPYHLRDRKEDIIPLSFLFLNKFNNKYGQNKRISATVLQQLQSYDWPGNIRQLKNTIEMMCVLSSGGELEVPEFVSEIHVKDNKSIQAVRRTYS